MKKYKVIAEYPSSAWAIGCILEYNPQVGAWAFKFSGEPHVVWDTFASIRRPDKYPAIFQEIP